MNHFTDRNSATLSIGGLTRRPHQTLKGFDDASINRSVGRLFSKRDEMIFETLFWPFLESSVMQITRERIRTTITYDSTLVG